MEKSAIWGINMIKQKQLTDYLSDHFLTLKDKLSEYPIYSEIEGLVEEIENDINALEKLQRNEKKSSNRNVNRVKITYITENGENKTKTAKIESNQDNPLENVVFNKFTYGVYLDVRGKKHTNNKTIKIDERAVEITDIEILDKKNKNQSNLGLFS